MSTLKMDKESAILQGGFLLADKMCLPSCLCSLDKMDWSRVGHPILTALKEICGGEDLSAPTNSKATEWKKKLICVVWLKLLSCESGEDIEAAWRENPFFPLQNALPEVNHVVLLELVKSLSATEIYACLLLSLPKCQIYSELERLVRYVKSTPTSEEDIRFLLDVWWVLWRGKDKLVAGGEDSIEMTFANQYTRLTSELNSGIRQAAKRIRLDTGASTTNTDILYVLIHALRDLKDHICTMKLCLKALNIALDILYTSFLIKQAVVLPTHEKMQFLSIALTIREQNHEKLGPELIREAQQDLSTSLTPAHFQPTQIELAETLKIITEVAQFWQTRGMLEGCGSSEPSYTMFRLQQSARRVLVALEDIEVSESDCLELDKKSLIALLESLSLPTTESTPEMDAKVAMAIISHRLDDYQNFALLVARERSWPVNAEQWINCLEENHAAFQRLDTLVALASALASKISSFSVSQCRKLIKAATDVFSALSLEDKNEALAAMCGLSGRGFFGFSAPPAVNDGFEQELNMAFNCIIQGGTRAPVQGNLGTAVALVARVAFQNPEATLRACCHSAIFNKGAFSLMAQILQQLPGLRGPTDRKDKDLAGGGGEPSSGSSPLCSGLRKIIRTRSLSGNEKEQFLKFLGLLMMPFKPEEGEGWSFLSPQEVVRTFVLPNISFTSHGSVDIDTSLQLLHSALCVDIQEPASSPHWVLDCSPFPLLYVVAQLYNQALRCWEQPPEGAVHPSSMDTKELLVSVLTKLARVVGAEVAADPGRWSRALFWLHDKVEGLDWTVGLHLKPVWGEHFKNEVPSSLLTVCDLPEQDWSGLDLPQYSQGTGLLAWMECCSLSDTLQSVMLSQLALDQHRHDHVSMFSKGVLVALAQILPWCSPAQWDRILGALKELLASGCLHVPFSLEYVDFLPLLDLRRFSYELCLSVLLLRVLQLLCGSSCSHWLTEAGWAHVGRLYAHTVREILNSLRAKLPLKVSSLTAAPPKTPTPVDSSPSIRAEMPQDSLSGVRQAVDPQRKFQELHFDEKVEPTQSQEVLFVLSQVFCHVQHVQVMMPGGPCEPLFLSSLEILSYYEAMVATFPHSCNPVESENTRHFFSTITDNLDNPEMKSVLQQKIAQLGSSPA